MLHCARPPEWLGCRWPSGRACLKIDLRKMPDNHRLSKAEVSTHIGTNALPIGHLVRDCEDFLRQALMELKAFLENSSAEGLDSRSHEHAAPLVILCACDWGKHRSVTVAWVLSNLLSPLGHHTQVRHMSMHKWSRQWSCGLGALHKHRPQQRRNRLAEVGCASPLGINVLTRRPDLSRQGLGLSAQRA